MKINIYFWRGTNESTCFETNKKTGKLKNHSIECKYHRYEKIDNLSIIKVH